MTKEYWIDWFVKNNKCKDKRYLCFGWLGTICDRIAQKQLWFFQETMTDEKPPKEDCITSYGYCQYNNTDYEYKTADRYENIIYDASHKITHFI